MKSLNFKYDIFSRPQTGKSLGWFDYDFPKLSAEQLHQKYGSISTMENPNGTSESTPPPKDQIPIENLSNSSIFERILDKINIFK